MKIKYQISTSYENCEVNFNDKVYSYESLKKILKEEIKIYKKRLDRFSKKKPTSKKIDIEYDRKKFGSSKLTAKEIREYLFSAKQSKAKSWISSQRKKRKEGKLTQDQVNDLNRLGMVWNPTTDEWEKNYSLYKSERLYEVIKYVGKGEDICGEHWIQRSLGLSKWINKQYELYDQNELTKENLSRLVAADFPFESRIEKRNLIQLNAFLFICRIRELSNELSNFGKKRFINHYIINQDSSDESRFELEEDLILKKKQKQKLRSIEENLSFKRKSEKTHSEIEENERKKILALTKFDFLKRIDKISSHRTLTWNQKNNFYVDDDGEKIPVYIKKYNDIYFELRHFLKDRFPCKTKIKHYEYHFLIKLEFEKEIKTYAAKKMIGLMDNHLLKYGVFNKQKKIEPISYLLDLYNKEKNKEGIVELKNLIEKHELLSLIYRKKIMQVYHKIF